MPKKTAVQLAIQQLNSAYANLEDAARVTTSDAERAELEALARWVARARYDADSIDAEQRRRLAK